MGKHSLEKHLFDCSGYHREFVSVNLRRDSSREEESSVRFFCSIYFLPLSHVRSNSTSLDFLSFLDEIGQLLLAREHGSTFPEASFFSPLFLPTLAEKSQGAIKICHFSLP